MYEPLTITWIKNRIKRGFAPIVLVTGKQRIGKTCIALLFASLIEPTFNIKEQLFFDIRSFAQAYNKFNNKVFCLDEAGIELDTYRYSDIRQRVFSHIVQSQAYKQNTLFIVLPHNTDIAKTHRKYIDALICVMSRGFAVVYKPRIKYWDMNDLDITTKKMEVITQIPLPPKELYDDYKMLFEKQIKENIMGLELTRLEKELNKGMVTRREIPTYSALHKSGAPPTLSPPTQI